MHNIQICLLFFFCSSFLIYSLLAYLLCCSWFRTYGRSSWILSAWFWGYEKSNSCFKSERLSLVLILWVIFQALPTSPLILVSWRILFFSSFITFYLHKKVQELTVCSHCPILLSNTKSLRDTEQPDSTSFHLSPRAISFCEIKNIVLSSLGWVSFHFLNDIYYYLKCLPLMGIEWVL